MPTRANVEASVSSRRGSVGLKCRSIDIEEKVAFSNLNAYSLLTPYSSGPGFLLSFTPFNKAIKGVTIREYIRINRR
jgi:hypothetical protein